MARREGHGPTPTPPLPQPPPPPPPPPPPSMGIVTLLVLLGLLSSGVCSQYGDAEHITAILGESVILNCPVAHPNIPYIIQWKRQHHKIPIYIWYEGYDPHVEDKYKGRASRVNPDTTFGLASLNLTSVKESDQGWYECKVYYLDRSGATDNGTWIHLDVHAPPRFTTTPDDVTYVNIGDSIILNCEAEGTPKPEIFWFRDDNSVVPSDTVGIFNDGTELRINKIRDQDIGDYVCVARNAEGRVHHEAKVVIAGGAVIVTPPHNQTKQEGERAEFPCEAKALPGNVTVTWKREGVAIDKLSWLDTRSIIRRDGTLVINPTSADDGGFFTCEVSNGIGTPQSATAFLNVEYPARVTYTPTVQYLPFRQQGIIKCFIKSNPPIQFVTWIKDKRLFDAENESTVVKLNNGSLLITKVNQSHQGRYSCTPYNRHTTAGSSGDMEVLVHDPPIFSPRPQQKYHGQVSEEVTLVCGGQGSPTPEVTWKRRDSQNLPRDRTDIVGGNLTIRNLRKSDHAYYECMVSNEIATLVASTQLLVEGTTPHPPYNISRKTDAFSVKLSWQPGYPGGKDWDQQYTIWYRTQGSRTWSQIDVKPPGSTSVTIHNLMSDHTYEFQIQGKNMLGDGMFSDIVTATTKGDGNHDARSTPKPHIPTSDTSPEPVYDYSMVVFPTDSTGSTYIPTLLYPKGSLPLGPKPAPPRNVSIAKASDGFVISWLPPSDSTVPVAYYDIEYRNDGSWKKLNDGHIVDETSYTIKKLNSGKKYHFRVFAKTLRSFASSPEVSFVAPVQNKEKAITAALVGGILFFIVAIILSVCTVKICNKRKRKKQEKELQSHIFYDTQHSYSMVACRASETRNGGHGSSPVPLKKLLRCGIPCLRWEWAWMAGVLLGGRLLDSTDSRPLDTSAAPQDISSGGQEASERTSTEDYREYGVQRGRRFPRDVRYQVELEYSQPLEWISRTTDGRFVLDQSSEEGGFTSPRRPARGVAGLSGRRHQDRPQTRVIDEGGVESGVYHVRDGTASRLHHRQPLPPRFSLRSDGSGASTHEELQPGARAHIISKGRWDGLGTGLPHVSPEFGRHVIPTTPGEAVWSPRSKRFRTSSPGPLTTEWDQLAQLASFSEVSSVQQPSSVERSFPSTVLSSFPNSAQGTPSAHGVSGVMSPPLHGENVRAIHQRYSHRQLPPLSSSQVHPRRILVGAQVHSPPPQIYPQMQTWASPSHPSLGSTWTIPRRPLRVWSSTRPVSHSTHTAGRPELTVLESGQHVHSPPVVRAGQVVREAIGHIQPPRIPDIPRHYVNLPPRRDAYQRIPGRDPPYLLKPSTSENQKPLATSSPPRPRAFQGRQRAQALPRPRPLPPPPLTSTKTLVPDPLPRALGRIRDSDSSSDQPVTYTRERLQEAIGRVRSGLFGTTTRTNSAPELSSAGRSEMRHVSGRRYGKPSGSGSAPVSHEQSQEHSQEQSPDSSGFGSKNTSQQQSSSQSGQSLSALGLDSSRLEASEVMELSDAQDVTIPSPPAWLLAAAPARPTPWVRPRNPPPYEEWAARQVLPQFRMPVMIGSHHPNVRASVVGRRQRPGSTGLDGSLDSGSSVKVSPRPPPITIPVSPQQPLDVSVDDHYEFDTVLSPTPGEDVTAEWSRTRVPSGERGLSDSEIYGSGGRRRHESMEARVAAMKQEFNEYRRRQARRRRSRELESVC